MKITTLALCDWRRNETLSSFHLQASKCRWIVRSNHSASWHVQNRKNPVIEHDKYRAHFNLQNSIPGINVTMNQIYEKISALFLKSSRKSNSDRSFGIFCRHMSIPHTICRCAALHPTLQIQLLSFLEVHICKGMDLRRFLFPEYGLLEVRIWGGSDFLSTRFPSMCLRRHKLRRCGSSGCTDFLDYGYKCCRGCVRTLCTHSNWRKPYVCIKS